MAIWLEEYLNKLEISIENCKTATINVLCVGKRKEEMKTLNLNKDVINIIAKMLWRTRREVEVWGGKEVVKLKLKTKRKKRKKKYKYKYKRK